MKGVMEIEEFVGIYGTDAILGRVVMSNLGPTIGVITSYRTHASGEFNFRVIHAERDDRPPGTMIHIFPITNNHMSIILGEEDGDE